MNFLGWENILYIWWWLYEFTNVSINIENNNGNGHIQIYMYKLISLISEIASKIKNGKTILRGLTCRLGD